MRRLVSLPLLLVLAACLTTPQSRPVDPGPGPGPAKGQTLHAHVIGPQDDSIAGAVVTILDNQNAGKAGTTGANGQVFLNDLVTPSEFTVRAEAEGFEPGTAPVRLVSPTGGPMSGNVTIRLAKVPPITKPSTARRGQVRADRHVLVDDDGPFLALGTSLFWGLWGELHDVERLEQNLKAARDAGFDYVRVLATVGPSHWRDRTVRVTDPGWQDAVRSFTDRAYAHGLRVQWTIFGSANDLSTSEQDRTVAGLLDAIEGRHHKVAIIEIANEAPHGNGPSASRATEFGRRVRSRFPGLLASSAPIDDLCASQRGWYSSDVWSLITLHFSRIRASDGLWRPTRQPWREAAFTCEGLTAKAYANNEPIGPQSSVEQDDDDLRMALQCGTSFVTGVGACIYHTGAGIRGGGAEDLARGRPPNLSESPRWATNTAAIRALRDALPPDVPNWSKHNMHWESTPLRVQDTSALMRQYCATSGGRFVCVVLDQRGTVRVTARAATKARVLNPVGLAEVQSFDVPAGATVTYPQAPDGLLVIGEQR